MKFQELSQFKYQVNKETLAKISRYVVVVAYFAKEKFINKLNSADFEVVNRLKEDANLMYLYHGEKKKRRGQPKKT
jgi:hypothetical protein